MRKVEPQEARGCLNGVAHKVMVIGPDDSDEKIAYRVAQPCRPERQESLEGRELGRTQFQHQHRDEDGEHTIRKGTHSLRGGSMEHGRTSPYIPEYASPA